VVAPPPPTLTEQPPSPTPQAPTPIPATATPTSPPDDDDDDDDGPDNLAPIAVPDTVVMAEDDPPVFIPVLANDSDPDGRIISNTLKIVNGPANGTATINPASAEISYTPNPNFNGQDQLTYRICDNKKACSIASVTITVTPVNDPPIAVDDSATTDEDTSVTINVLANDVDPDGDLLTVVSTTPPANGTVTINPNNTITYTPGSNFDGSIIFTYQISDGVATATATVTVVVIPVNDPPTAVDDSANTAEDSSQLVLVLDNDFDPDGPNPLSIIAVSSPANGTAVIDLPGIRYIPNPDFSGVDTFTYTITDGALTDTATVTVTVIPINDPPVAVADNYSTPVSSTLTVPAPGVLANDTDVDSANVTVLVSSVTGPADGTLAINPDGSFTYTPDPAFTGNDTFTYQATDGTATSNTVTVTIGVP
jgi:VCBS repeat-containing protein